MFSPQQIIRFIGLYIDVMAFVGYLLGCVTYRRYKPLQAIGFLLIVTMARNQFSSYAGMYYKNHIAVDHIYNPIQFALLCFFFYSNFEKSVVKKSVPYILGAGMVFAVLNTVFLQGWHDLPSNFIMFETLMLIVWATILFIEKLDAPANTNVFKDPIFITATAILCFNIFSFIFFLLRNYFAKHQIKQLNSIYNILFFANFIYYGLLVMAFIYSYKSVKNSATSRW